MKAKQKLRIYIDFESISHPFNKNINVIMDFPYAYTLGILIDECMVTRTFVYEFATHNSKNIFDILRIQIIRDVRDILSSSTFSINAKTVEFIAFSNFLEKKILRNVYRGVKVLDIIKNNSHSISLSMATNKEFGNKTYFKTLKQIIKNNIDNETFGKRGFFKDGVLAAYAGYLLYARFCCDEMVQKKCKFFFEFDAKTLLNEIKNYSRDDVLRMELIINNRELFENRITQWSKVSMQKSKLENKRHLLQSFLYFLSNYDSKTNIKDVTNNINNEMNSITSNIDDLKKFKF